MDILNTLNEIGLWFMQTDVNALHSFYERPEGQMAKSEIMDNIHALWPHLDNQRLIGIGYTLPWLNYFIGKTERCLALMPAQLGAVAWPEKSLVSSALVWDQQLPLPDSSVDRILMVHALEHAENAQEILYEAWRVLTPNGRMILVVPNRRGRWVRQENTPFGDGRPFGRHQIDYLLQEADFSLLSIKEILHFSPLRRPLFRHLSGWANRLTARFFPWFGGVFVIEIQKRIFQGIGVEQHQRREKLFGVLRPQASQARNMKTVE